MDDSSTEIMRIIMPTHYNITYVLTCHAPHGTSNPTCTNNYNHTYSISDGMEKGGQPGEQT